MGERDVDAATAVSALRLRYAGEGDSDAGDRREHDVDAAMAVNATSTFGVVVVGGGVVGVSVAYALAREGVEVVLLERGRLAGEASFGNAGTVSAGHPPLNKPGRVAQGVRQLSDPTSPLYVKPRWDPELWRWLTRFATYCTDAHVKSAMEVLAPMGMDSLRAFEDLVGREGIDCGYHADGYYAVCETGDGLADAVDEAELIRRFGYKPEVLDARAMGEVEPALAPVAGGVFYPEAATLCPYDFTVGLAEAAARHGAVLREGVEVTDVLVGGGAASGVRLSDGDEVGADAVVLATGPFSLAIADRLGAAIPVQPGKGYHRDIPISEAGASDLRIACVLHEASVFCTPMSDFVRFAGTMEFSGLNHEMRPDRLAQIARAAGRFFPALGSAPPISEWCGLRPVSVDGLPIVGPLPHVPNVVVATGHGMLGLTLGPVSGDIVADWVLRDGPVELYRRLGPDRFGG